MSSNRKAKAVQLLRGGADLIDQVGWLASSGGSHNTGFCAFEAMTHAATKGDKLDRTAVSNIGWSVRALASVVVVDQERLRRLQAFGSQFELQKYCERQVFLWNDHRAAGAEEVTMRMREAAALLDEEE